MLCFECEHFFTLYVLPHEKPQIPIKVEESIATLPHVTAAFGRLLWWRFPKPQWHRVVANLLDRGLRFDTAFLDPTIR